MKTTAKGAAIAALLLLAGCQSEVKPENITAQVTEAASPQASSASEGFWRHWSDGKAELSGYDLIQPRYGEKRHGRAVLVFVTEPYSRSRKVKVDRYNPNDPDHAMALKLNHVRKFQTGVYDYSVMTSVFVDPTRGFAPMEINFSMQEWCGHVFEEIHFDADGASFDLNSYVEGESRREKLTMPSGALAEDNLLIQLRGLGADALDTRAAEVDLLPSANFRRLNHRPVQLTPSKITWSDAPAEITVPAGTFQAREATWRRMDGSSCTAQLEVAYPHRILGWRCDDGELARLTGSTRLAYWGTHREGDEKLLSELGLAPVGFTPTSEP